MKKIRVFASALLAILVLLGLVAGASRAGAAPPAPRLLAPDSVPAAVRNGTAQLTGPHAAADPLLVLFMLPLRDQAGLDAFLAAVSNPRSPTYGHYLTESEVTARFGPEPAHADHVAAWLQANGITDVQTPADRLYVATHAPASTLARLLGVQINDYRVAGRTFFAPDRAPTLPAEVAADVQWVTGLDSDSQIHTALQKKGPVAPPSGPRRPNSTAPYAPSDFQDAYDTHPLLDGGFNGSGLSLAITLWTLAPSDSRLDGWATDTGSPVPTRANGRLQEIFTDGGPSTDGDDGEAALDIESTGGMAPGATIRYYEAKLPQNANLAVALNVAGSDVNNRIISNSWGEPENTSAHNALDGILATHSASGHAYFFSSGDDGSWANRSDPYPDYPTSSKYVVSVGGTAFANDITGGWPGETTWVYNPTGNNGHPEGSGGGFSLVDARPSWQVGPGTTGAKRGYPDIAADADPNTGAYICTDANGCIQIGGTSLAAPLWAGMTLIMDQYLVAQGRPHVGFLSPALYALANAPQTYPAFHDITQGTNGAYHAGANWDAVTGIGSPDLWNLSRDLRGSAPPPPTATPVPPPPSPTPAPCVPGQFSDVHPTNYFYTPVQYLVSHGAISGYGDCTFRPYNNATRGQLAKIIVAAQGWAIDTTGGPHFSDVSTSNPFYIFIETAFNRGVISGYGDGTFHPNANVTRGQLSKIIVTARGWAINTTGGPHFSDVGPGNPFYSVIETAFNHGIISGYGDGTFHWGANAIRGQISKIIYLAVTGP